MVSTLTTPATARSPNRNDAGLYREYLQVGPAGGEVVHRYAVHEQQHLPAAGAPETRRHRRALAPRDVLYVDTSLFLQDLA
jgi:hypothetical protein